MQNVIIHQAEIGFCLRIKSTTLFLLGNRGCLAWVVTATCDTRGVS